MTSPLLTAFVDASEKERWRLHSQHADLSVGESEQRFIADRAAMAGMRAVLEAAGVRTVAPVELRRKLLEMVGDDG